MSWDSVPWFVGGGATHSPEVARLLAYAAVGGAEGIVGPSDLKVAPLSVPGTSVRVLSGAALILNRATGGAQQTYVARNPTVDTVPIALTGSSGGRSDLIVAQIEDPNMPGEPWQVPSDPAAGPYVFTRVIPNVPAGTLRLQDVPGYAGRSAITLARVDLPASTGTVTASMITDVRRLARPRTWRSTVSLSASGGNLASTASEVKWPAETYDVDVPTWATRVVGQVTITGITQAAGSVETQHRLRFGPTLAGQTTYFASTETQGARQALTVPIDLVVPADLRGKRVNALVLSRRRSGAASFAATSGSVNITYDLQFEETIE